ncbi:MAG: hypothetical protein R2857_01040 [Vampirovibrionales bacterium]
MDTDGTVVNRYGQPIPEDAIDYSLIDTSQRIDPEMLGPMRKGLVGARQRTRV